jgi:hypothetical protein
MGLMSSGMDLIYHNQGVFHTLLLDDFHIFV